MQIQTSQKTLIDPYRTMGTFVSGKLSISQSFPITITTPTNTSFKVYSETLAIKVASPPFAYPITAAVSHNEYTYIRTKNEVIKTKYLHIVDKWEIEGSAQTCHLLSFQSILLLAEGNTLYLINEQTHEISSIKIDFEIIGMLHPVTYVNKVILFSSNQFILINPTSHKILYHYPKLKEWMQNEQCQIVQAKQTHLVDIVAVSFTNGCIAFLNLKKDSIVFTVKQKLPPKSIAFSNQNPYMATGDQIGNVFLWDLESKKILYKFQKAFENEVDSLVFLPGLSVLTCGSSKCNSIKQYRINLEDNKILCLFRERVGNILPLEQIIIANNNELVCSTEKESMFMSFHSLCNSYLLPRTLDSKLPYHIISSNFNVLLYQNQTQEKSFKINQKALIGKISLSRRYYIIATKSRIIKLGSSVQTEWKISNVRHIELYNEHYIFAFTHNELIVCDFMTDQIVFRTSKTVINPVINLYQNMIAFQNIEQKTIQIWGMEKIAQGRSFSLLNKPKTLCLAFTSDNKYLLSSHEQARVIVWSIIDNEVYKEYEIKTKQNIIWLCFTPDNQFMVSVFEKSRESNIWNNYIGKISSNRNIEKIAFTPEIKTIDANYRRQLNKTAGNNTINYAHSEVDVIDQIEDAKDSVAEYSFEDIGKWMSLVYYDEIKARNTPEMSNESSSIPFFLDFRNLTEEKEKIRIQIENEAKQKRRIYNQKKDKQLEDKDHEIKLDEHSISQDYINTYVMLAGLSIAEVDYQLRRFLINPVHKMYLIKMVKVLAMSHHVKLKQEVKNIIINRILNLLGGEIFEEELREDIKQILSSSDRSNRYLKERIDRCVAIVEKRTQ